VLLGGGGLPPVVNQDDRSNLAKSPAQEDGARLVPVTPVQVTPGDQQMIQAVERFAETGELFNYLFRVKMSSTLKKPVVQVIDLATGEEICEIPPDTIMQMLEEMGGTASGTIVDSKV